MAFHALACPERNGFETMTTQAASNLLDALRPDKSNERVTLGDIADRAGREGYAALVLVPAALVASPLSGVPGLSALMGISIALLAIQMAAGRSGLWLPGWLRRRSVNADKLENALKALRKPARFADRYTARRLSALTSDIAGRLIAVLACIGGLAMPFLELVPFSSSIIGSVIAVQMLGLFTRDGLVVLASLVPPLIAGAVALYI